MLYQTIKRVYFPLTVIVFTYPFVTSSLCIVQMADIPGVYSQTGLTQYLDLLNHTNNIFLTLASVTK